MKRLCLFFPSNRPLFDNWIGFNVIKPKVLSMCLLQLLATEKHVLQPKMLMLVVLTCSANGAVLQWVYAAAHRIISMWPIFDVGVH